MDLPTFSAIGPEVWGRSYWEFLDAIVATFPKDNPPVDHRNAVYDLLNSLRFLLPCPTCRKHYADFLQKHSLDQALICRKTLVEFYFLLKRDVSHRTNKNSTLRNPDELWQTIIRRMKLAKPTSASLQVTTAKQPFRVPARVYNNAASATVKKGCGCKKS